MSFIGVCITCAVGFAVLMGTFKGLTFFFKRRMKKGYELRLPTFLFGAAALFGIVLFGVLGGILYPFNTPESLQVMGITALALGTLFLTENIIPKASHRFIWLFLLCLAGTVLAPQTAAFWALPFSWAFCLAFAGLWAGFVLMMTLFDRVILVAFLALSALIIGVVLSSSMAFPLFPDIFNVAFLVLLFLLLGLVYYLKNNGCYILGKPALFFVSYLIGYMGVVLAASGRGRFVPIFVSYELFELVIAMGTNFWLYKRFFPLETPLMVETALMKNIAPGKLLRSVFWWCLLFVLLGMVSSASLGGYLVAPYVCAGLFLSLVYIRLKDWGKPKVKYKDLFSDLKNGFQALKNDMMNPSLKKKPTTPKDKEKK